MLGQIRDALLFFAIILNFVSCGPGSDEEQLEYIDRAITALSSGNCSEAFSYLNKVTSYSTSSDYIETLASAYACRTGFREQDFYIVTLPGLDATNAQTFITSIVTFASSTITSTADSHYTDTELAINTILYGGGVTNPSVANRIATFGNRDGTDLSLQAVPLILTQLGRFLYYYGNADGAGTKGAGTQTNDCIYTYTDPVALAALPAGSCTATPDGHDDLDTATDEQKVEIMCKGAVLLGNLIDILNNINISAADETGNLDTLSSAFSVLCGSAFSEFCTLTSQSECELDYAVGSGFETLEQFYAVFIENSYL